MAVIGQLIMCQNIDNAAIIFRAILTVALSETESTLANGEETLCEKEKKEIKIYSNWSVFISHSVSEVFIALYYIYQNMKILKIQ